MAVFLVLLALGFFVGGAYFYGEVHEKPLGVFLIMGGFSCIILLRIIL
jgi:hypothetical protein